MQKLKDYFLHTSIFNLDKEGRPVSTVHKIDDLSWSVQAPMS